MVPITRAEKDAVRAKFPKVYIVRTMKHDSKRGHYYCEENRQVIRYINELRGAGAPQDR